MIAQQVLKKKPRFKQNKTKLSAGGQLQKKRNKTRHAKNSRSSKKKNTQKIWLKKRKQNKARSKAKAQGEAGEARERQVRRPLAGRGGPRAPARPPGLALGGGAPGWPPRGARATPHPGRGPPPAPLSPKFRTWTELGQRSMGLEWARRRRSCLVSSFPQRSGGRGLESSRWTTRRREGEGYRIPDARPSQAASRSEGDVTSA